ncbi:membrane protein involved in aromatic hydrocarbon degradation [Thioalkalivibrio sp. K90mix]|uniref:OmpP1/FadL family transporter n=1 Tax=Thioalkalivibrio sp. (strain K90mix) TaxID=396595 RepID=UPI000195A37B|nr:outer membrane protein transport protein [Thioalkalivibrio sp. K90mix]ADC71160.1 membrane protein involved in aromatic hydrocarbon degradation [Thioalkalivibrio sp. K90mix]
MEARIIRRSLVTVAVGLAMGSAGVANATNGYFAHGYGTKAKGMGGVGMAISQDAYAPGINPAGIAGMESRIDGSLTYFRPERSFEAGMPSNPAAVVAGAPAVNPGSVDSDSENFFIPSLAFVQQIDENRSWGLALLGNGGMNTDYPAYGREQCAMMGQGNQGGAFCGGTAGVNLEQLAIIPTYAQKFADGRVSVGFSPIISYQRFSAEGLDAFDNEMMSADPGNVTSGRTDSSWGYGAQIGFQAELAEGARVGASYRSKIRAGDFDRYSGLFANGGEFDIPSTYGLGFSVDVSPRVTLSADYQKIRYSEIDAIANPSTNQAQFGADGGPGFGWDDVNIFKFGAQIDGGNGWTWRVGYNRGENPISSEDVMLNILAPAVMTDHFTAGFTREFGQHEINFAAMYAPTQRVRGQDITGMAGQDIEIEMRQYELEIGYAYRF